VLPDQIPAVIVTVVVFGSTSSFKTVSDVELMVVIGNGTLKVTVCYVCVPELIPGFWIKGIEVSFKSRDKEFSISQSRSSCLYQTTTKFL
jgi:hypothetical protein